MIKVAIVILNWNGKSFLQDFLPPLKKHSSLPEVKIIVADNKSGDDSLTFLKTEHPDIDIIELNENFGFAGGYNKALEQVEAEYYLLLNSDIEVTENWLEPLISFLDQHLDYAACSPMLLDFNKRMKYEYAGAAGGYIDKLGYTFCRGRIFNTVEDADFSASQSIDVFWTTGACMLIRADLFKEIGGFDPVFFAHMEEVDLCWRLKNEGHNLAIVPASRIYHVGGGTLPKSNPFKTYLNFRNNLLLLYKNLPTENIEWIIFKRMLMDGLSAMLFLLSFKLKDISSIYKAHLSFRSKKKTYKNYRKEQENKHGFPKHKEIYEKSIVFDYFIAGNKKFSQLRNNFGERMDKKIII